MVGKVVGVKKEELEQHRKWNVWLCTKLKRASSLQHILLQDLLAMHNLS